ncbi:MAG: hypothetical protein KatS3mg124_2303 [Porticoccaceae bacterium]|nr:MAG: hypothetical protein KatS3mg124_2303 [Porticoccaceae bacterium]
MPSFPRPSAGALWWTTLLVGSLVLSSWRLASAPVLNDDAVLYLIGAERYLAGGFDAALATYGWPFLSVAIAWLHRLTGLPLPAAGLLLENLSLLLLAVAFCRTARLLGGDRAAVSWWALLLVLSHPLLNDFRAKILRDPGFAACLLLALSAQCRFATSGRLRHAAGWAAALAAGSLFRVEALAFALLSPWLLLRRRPDAPGSGGAPALTLALPAGLGLLALGGWGLAEAEAKPAQLAAALAGGAAELGERLQRLAEFLGRELFAPYARDYAPAVLLLAVLLVTAGNAIQALTLPWAAAWLFHLRRGVPVPPRERGLLYGYAAIAAAYLAGFTLFAGFNMDRYCLPLALLLLAPLAPSLAAWWRRGGAARALLLAALAVNAAAGLWPQGDKVYLRQAASWIAANDAIPPRRLLTDEPYLGYFGGKSDLDQLLAARYPEHRPTPDTWALCWLPGYFYAVRTRDAAGATRLAAEVARARGQVLARFANPEGRAVWIFQVARATPRSPPFQWAETARRLGAGPPGGENSGRPGEGVAPCCCP